LVVIDTAAVPARTRTTRMQMNSEKSIIPDLSLSIMSNSLSVYLDGVTPISCQNDCCGQTRTKEKERRKRKRYGYSNVRIASEDMGIQM